MTTISYQRLKAEFIVLHKVTCILARENNIRYNDCCVTSRVNNNGRSILMICQHKRLKAASLFSVNTLYWQLSLIMNICTCKCYNSRQIVFVEDIGTGILILLV